VKAKSAGILCGLQAFLLHSGADKRLLEAFYHYGAPPNRAGCFLMWESVCFLLKKGLHIG